MKPKFGYPVTADDYREKALARLPGFLFDYLDGGAAGEQTLRANATGWASINLRQRVLVNVEHVDTTTTLAGQACSMPVVLAPMTLTGVTRIADIGTDQLDRPHKNAWPKAGEEK